MRYPIYLCNALTIKKSNQRHGFKGFEIFKNHNESRPYSVCYWDYKTIKISKDK